MRSNYASYGAAYNNISFRLVMNTSNTLYSFRHEVGLRLIKLINLLCMVAAFAAVWFTYYKTLVSQYYFWGDVTIVAIFAVLYFSFSKTYDAFVISYYRIYDMISSQSLALIFSDAITYAVTLLCALLIKSLYLLFGLV